MARPTAVWSLDHTASSTLSIAKDVIRAATTDNVQALALVACEKFGATLAICPETNKKIEDLIIKVSGPKLVKFMSAQIGYSANDCATQLSQSLAGIQFLGLAAALVSSVGNFQGANALSVLLMASASDKTLVPTVRQLKDLLGALEHRVNRSGFTDIWVGYQNLLIGSLGAFQEQSRLPSGKSHREIMDFIAYPATEGIQKLVEAFRELDRLGNVIAVTIDAFSCAPWVMAFTRWCLGIPPSTYLPNGKALLDQVDSRVTLFTSQNFSALKISIKRSVGSPAELVKSQLSSRSPFGIVSLECFGRIWCQRIGGEGSDTYKAVSEALPYALKQVHELLIPFEFPVAQNRPKNANDSYREQRIRLASKYPVESRAQPFSNESTISNILTRVLNLESQQILMSLSEGHLISDLPLLRACLGRLEETCTCDPCRPLHLKPTNAFETPSYLGTCKLDVLLDSISVYVADILALSLFENPGTLLVLLDRHDFNIPNFTAYLMAVGSIITSGKSMTCETRSVIDWALGLVGHDRTSHVVDEGRETEWIMSCSKGQAVYPKVFETRNICQPGYLVLYWAPGLLFFNGEKYDRGTSAKYHGERVSDVDEALQRQSVIGPLNAKPNMKMEWKITCCEGYLEILLVCEKTSRNPFDILLNLGSSLILRGCPHDSASPLERPDRLAIYRKPIYPFLWHRYHPLQAEKKIDVVAVDGNAGLRMIAVSTYDSDAMAGTPFCVIRDNSCLQCCLDLCRKVECSVLIC